MRSDEILRRYRQRLNLYRERTSAFLAAAWVQLPGIDESDLPAFEQSIAVPLVGAKAATVALSSAFFALILDIPPVGVAPDDIEISADTRGPFRATWHALAMGRPFEEALTVGRSTAQAVGFDFVQSTSRRTGDVVAEKSGERVTWRRVPGAGACDWCHLVAGQAYRTAASADFGHERDGCLAVPTR